MEERTYKRTGGDWLSVQADVAGCVARSIMKELFPEDRHFAASREDAAVD